MTAVFFLIAKYQAWAYAALGLLALFYLRAFWLAWVALQRTLFGLEKEGALQRQNLALAMLIIVAALAVFVYMNDRILVPNMVVGQATPMPTPLPPTSTPIKQNAGPLVVDSSGCKNPNVTLTAPKSGERLSGAFEVKGTAAMDSLAFFSVEINGLQTGGDWLPVIVDNTAVHNGVLGRFDSSAYPPGDYVLRLVVKNTAGNYPRPCEVLVTIVAVEPTPTLP